MKSIPIDVSALRFLVASAPEQVMDFESKRPKEDRDGQSIFSVDLLVSGEGRKGELITVKVAGGMPTVSEGERAKIAGLVAMPWSANGRAGISYSATNIAPTTAASSKAA